MNDTAYFTICSRNYMAYAITLYNSLIEADPSAKFFCFLADEDEGVESVPFPVIRSDRIGIPNFADMTMRYTVMEFNTAIKPFCLEYLFEKENAKHAVYLDPDLYILRPLSHVETALEKGADIVLTPHSLTPLDDGGDPDDIRLMRTGAYNLGFGAFADTPPSRKLIRWWAEQLRTKCVVDLENGLFVDQKFMDLAPCYVSNASILHHPGYNVAYWNMPGRTITSTNGWSVNGEPLHFFHFSGVVPGDYSVFSKHQNRYTPANIGELKSLLNEYLDTLERNEHSRWSTIPYAYNFFPDGTPIAAPMRQCYARKYPSPAPDKASQSSDDTLYNGSGGHTWRYGCKVPVTNLMYEVWESRSDLKQAFDMHSDQGRREYLDWFANSAASEAKIDEKYIEPARNGLQQFQPSAGKAISRRAQLSRLALKYARNLQPVYRHISPNIRAQIVSLLLRQGYQSIEDDRRLVPENHAEHPTRDKVNMFGYFSTESGVGEAARRNYDALTGAGVNVTPFTLYTNSNFADAIDEVPAPGDYKRRAVNIFHINADQMLTLNIHVHESFHADSYNIGYWAWELEKFPQEWLGALDLVDEIWVPSQFTQKSIQQVTGKPVHVIPHVVPERPVQTEPRQRFGLRTEDFVILTAFDLNSYHARKNPSAAIEAFQTAFPDNDDVRFVLKFHGKGGSGFRKILAATAGQDPRILLVDEVMSRDAVDALQSACDVFLSLHRAEGFGLNIAECMRKSKPVIVTAYSGNMDFTDTTNSMQVGYTLKPVAGDEYPFHSGQTWADPDIAQAASALQKLYHDRDFGLVLGTAARKTIESQCSPEKIGSLMSQRLSEIDKLLATKGAVEENPQALLEENSAGSASG